MQCPACFKRVRRLKNGTIPKHFGLETRLLSWEQKVCSASGSRRSGATTSSDRRCPCCRQKVAFRADGRVRVHNANGNECPASVANR